MWGGNEDTPDIRPDIVSSGLEKLCRVHRTRVELRVDCDDGQLRRIVDYVAAHPAITDAVLRTDTPLPDSLDEIERAVAAELRRTGSGRELPRLIVSTELGEVDFGPGCHIRPGPERGTAEITLWPYTLDYFRAMDPAFEWPEGVREDGGYPVVTTPGLRCRHSWGPPRRP